MDRLVYTRSPLFDRILRQRKQEAHPDKNPNNAEASGVINNAVDIVMADMKRGGPNRLALATATDIGSTVYSVKRDLKSCKAALKKRSEELDAMQVVAAEAKEYASWCENWAYDKEAAARYAEGDLARWKKWAYENEAAARHADRDLKSWKNWQSRIEEQHEAKQNVLQNQINEFKQRGSEAAGVPWAKKARRA